MTANDDIVPLRGTGDLRFATIAIGLGARHHGAGNVRMTDSNGVTIFNSADRPVPILQADAAALASLLEKAHAPSTDHSVVAFPAFARSFHSFEEYESVFPERRLMTEKLDGIGLCGPSKWVRSLTGSLKLLR